MIRKLVDARLVDENKNGTAYLLDVLTVEEERMEVWFPASAIELETCPDGIHVGDIYVATWFLPIKEGELGIELKVE